MKTLSVTQGRQRLGYWLKQAVAGHDIAFAFEGKLVALRPVQAYSEDYALREYAVSAEELEEFTAKADSELSRDKQANQLKPFNGRP